MIEKFYETLCEAMDCIKPYEGKEEINGFNLCFFFGYHFANAVYVEEKETGKTVGWDQYENELYLEGPNMETKNWKLTEQPELTANVEEVKNMLPTILADGNIKNFPVSQFLDKISQIDNDILKNYPIYWDKEHEGNREPVMESVPKDNLELCHIALDECAKQIGFTLDHWTRYNRKYVKKENTNYTYFIDFTPAMDKDQLKLEIFNDDGALAEQLVWTINNANDIRNAFNNLIYPRIEGLE